MFSINSYFFMIVVFMLVQSLVLYLNTRVENPITAELSAIKRSRRNSSANTELLQKINDLDRNISLMGYEVRDIKNGVGSRDSNSGSRRSGTNRTPQDYTGDIQTLWQDFDRLFKEKRRLEKRTESSMYSKISEEIRDLGERLGDATIRKFHKRLTRNPTEETIECIRLMRGS